MRLIDADKLMEHSGWYNLATGKSIHGVQVFEIASMPTIDAVSVRRGKWVCLEPEIGYFTCSECDSRVLRAKCNFCPYCGADMREVDHEGHD